jgi:1-acyl-sn-glycerol-3-phosphate acyltransferase
LTLAGFALFTLPLMPVQQAFVWLWPAMARRFPMHYHRAVLRVLGVRLTVVGQPPARGPVLIVSNHVGWLDIVVLSALAPLSFIAKREVNAWPFFGTLARLQRTVFVDRERKTATGASRNQLQERLRAGDILVLFAEGTSSDGTRVLPFRSALFGAAEIPGVVVQPLTVAYVGHRNLPITRRLRPLYAWYGDMELPPHLWQALATGPIEVKVVVHPPLSVSVALDRKALCRRAETLVRRALVEALHGTGKIG